MERKVKTVLWLGVAIFLIAFFGIPSVWKTGIFALLGIALVFLAVSLRRDVSSLPTQGNILEPEKPYSENGGEHESGKKIAVQTEEGI